VSDGGMAGGSGAERAGLFVSTFVHALDPKRRLTIPSDWRESVGDPPRLFVLPAGGRKCLLCYPARDMHRRIQKIKAMQLEHPRDRIMARTMLASMSDLVSWDTQGRIRIKDELLRHASLRDEVQMVGSFEGFELWNPAAWADAQSAVDAQRLLEATEAVDW
jgi:MraZ protein